MFSRRFLDEYSIKQKIFHILEEDLVHFLRNCLAEFPFTGNDSTKISREISFLLREIGVQPYPITSSPDKNICRDWLSTLDQRRNLDQPRLFAFLSLYRNFMYSFSSNIPFEFANTRDFITKFLNLHQQEMDFDEIYLCELHLKSELFGRLKSIYAKNKLQRKTAFELVESIVSEFMLLLLQEYSYKMTDSLNEQMQKNDKIAKINKSLDSDLKIASKQMRKIVQNKLPDDDKRIQFALWYSPLIDVGGDYYKVEKLSADEYAIFLADIAGHGITAAMYINTLDYCYQKLAKYQNRPAKLMQALNEELYGKIGDFFITGIYLYINLKKQQIIYSNAGHPKAVAYHLQPNPNRRDIWFLRQTGRVLGLFPRNNYNEKQIFYQQTCRIAVFTDGLIETFNDKQEILGERGLFTSFLDTNPLSLENTLEHVKQQILMFLGEPSDQDDKTLILCEIHL